MTAQTFGNLAPSLVENGYRPVPLYRRAKRPALDEWQNYQFSASDCEEYRNSGVGLLTGDLAAIDIDVRDETAARRIRALAEEYFGPMPARIGSAPKVALLCRAEEPGPKLKTRGVRLPGDKPGDKSHHVEILGKGQQIVAYGIHPDTGAPYYWNGAGEPAMVPIGLLPTASRAALVDFLTDAEKILFEVGVPVGRLVEHDDRREHRILAKTADELRASASPVLFDALQAIPNDDLDYDDWCRVGMAVKGAVGEEGRDEWLKWSAKSSKDVEAYSRKTWNSFAPVGIGAGTIYYLAGLHGWKRPTLEMEGVDSVPGAEQSGGLVLRPIHEVIAEKREPEWLLDDVIEANVLAVLAGPRSTFKSFVALDWSMRIAAVGLPVVILSGEGAGLDRRADAWIRTHGGGREPESFPVFVLERALNLNQDTDMVLLKTAIERIGRAPAMVVVDTYSKFSAGLDENDNSEVSAYLSRLSEHIRQALGSSVLLVAHSGHSDSGRPRGASSLMANPDAEYIITRANPACMSVMVSRERFKDCPALPPIWYDANVVDLGRVDKRGQPVTSLALSTGAPMVAAKVGAGKNQERALLALREFHRSNPDARFLTSQEIAAMFKIQGITAKRKPEVLNWLVNASILTTSIGGHSFDPSNL